MKLVLQFWHWYAQRTHIRPWGLAAAALVLLVALPMLRPLRYPQAYQVSDDERVRLATIQAIAEDHTLSLDRSTARRLQGVVQVDGSYYATQPPAFAAILSAPYRAMRAMGLSMDKNPVLVSYLLTVIGVTLPVALAAGILYRMGRVFELTRPWRMLLATGVIFCGGLISYSTVLNPHAPAATLVLGSAACLLHLGTIKSPISTALWIIMSGLWAALASVIDPTAGIFLILFTATLFAVRWKFPLRLGAVLLYLIGAAPPLLLHTVLTVPIFGTAMPPAMFLPPTTTASIQTMATTAPATDEHQLLTDTGFSVPTEQSTWSAALHWFQRLFDGLLGNHGLFSHFPVLLLAILGTIAIMHRHWPASTKTLATVSLLGSLIVVILTVSGRANWTSAMFASRWFIVFLPLVLFWAGGWLRRPHRKTSWVLALVLILFSAAVSLIGAANPYPPNGFRSWTAAAAWRSVLYPQSSQIPDSIGETPFAWAPQATHQP